MIKQFNSEKSNDKYEDKDKFDKFNEWISRWSLLLIIKNQYFEAYIIIDQKVQNLSKLRIYTYS